MAGSDFLASIAPWPIDNIWIGDRAFSIPALNADRWLEILLQPQISLWAILPGLLAEEDADDYITDLMVLGQVDRDEYEELCWEVIGIAAGREWWTALHLLNNAKAEAHAPIVRGELVLSGVDATRISLSAFLDALYMIFIRQMSEQNRQRFDMLISKAPAGVKRAISAERQRSNFEALMASG